MKFKLGAAHGRELLAAAIPIAPFYARAGLQKLLDNLKRDLVVEIEQQRRKHTDAQRGYYRMCLGMFAKHYKTDPENIHQIVLKACFGEQVIEINGKHETVPVQRSGKLGVEEYSQLIDTLIGIAAMAGFPLPDPMEVT